jgi:hypothetical protein
MVSLVYSICESHVNRVVLKVSCAKPRAPTAFGRSHADNTLPYHSNRRPYWLLLRNREGEKFKRKYPPNLHRFRFEGH